MAHEIFGERFVSREAPAWHRLGRVFGKDEKVSTIDAVNEIAGDIQIVQYPLWMETDDDLVRTDHYSVVRKATKESPEPLVLGVTSDRYKITQYQDLGRALAPMSEQYPVETAGVLKDGALMFIGLRGEDFAAVEDALSGHEAAKERVRALRALARDRFYVFNEEHPQVAGSRVGGSNGVSRGDGRGDRRDGLSN